MSYACASEANPPQFALCKSMRASTLVKNEFIEFAECNSAVVSGVHVRCNTLPRVQCTDAVLVPWMPSAVCPLPHDRPKLSGYAETFISSSRKLGQCKRV